MEVNLCHRVVILLQLFQIMLLIYVDLIGFLLRLVLLHLSSLRVHPSVTPPVTGPITKFLILYLTYQCHPNLIHLTLAATTLQCINFYL